MAVSRRLPDFRQAFRGTKHRCTSPLGFLLFLGLSILNTRCGERGRAQAAVPGAGPRRWGAERPPEGGEPRPAPGPGRRRPALPDPSRGPTPHTHTFPGFYPLASPSLPALPGRGRAAAARGRRSRAPAAPRRPPGRVLPQRRKSCRRARAPRSGSQAHPAPAPPRKTVCEGPPGRPGVGRGLGGDRPACGAALGLFLRGGWGAGWGRWV